MSYLLCECESLDKLELSKLNTQNVTDISFMFYPCKTINNSDILF